MVFRWPIEIDGWPIKNGLIFHGELLNNQRVYIYIYAVPSIQWIKNWLPNPTISKTNPTRWANEIIQSFEVLWSQGQALAEALAGAAAARKRMSQVALMGGRMSRIVTWWDNENWKINW